MVRKSTNTLDLVAEDLAEWIDTMANQLAEAMSLGGNAPFAAVLTEQQKLDYYTAQLFNPDGTPNLQGRAAQMQRLGPEGFALVYKAVLKAHPDLAVPTPPPGAQIPAGTDLAPVAGPKLPGLPPGLGIPRAGGMLPQGDAGAPVPVGGPLG
jgi:hypothetical protein